MGIHVNIGEAKTRLSELVAAAKRGEDVVIARAGEPEVRLVAIRPEETVAARRAARLRWMGSLKGQFPPGWGDSFLEPTFTEEELDEFEKPFGGDD